MTKADTKRIKLFFTVLIIIFSIILISGSFLLREFTAGVEKTIKFAFSSVDLQFAYGKSGDLLANINSAYINPENNQSAYSNNVPVLLYHGITSEPGRFNMTQENFKNQMFALKRAGYKTVKLDDFLEFIKGNKTLPTKSFLLTFDDARFDSYKEADPILSVLNYTAVMFVPTQATLHKKKDKEGYYLGISDLESMLLSGRWEIGSHAMQYTGDSVPIDNAGTEANFLSNRKWLNEKNRLENDYEYEERIKGEIFNSSLELEKTFGINVVSFSYPSSDYGQQSKNNSLAKSLISKYVQQKYEVAFEQVWKNEAAFSSNYIGDDMPHLKRIEPESNLSSVDLIIYLENAAAKTLPFEDNLSIDRGWKSSWGSVLVDNGELNIHAGTSISGSSAILDGTKNWKDYIYSFDLDWEKGSNLTLISRYKDHNNYVFCTFGEKTVKIGEKVNGETKTLISSIDTIDSPKSNVTLGMSVAGTVVRCLEGSRVAAIAYDAHQSLNQGGIGIQIWDKELDNALIKINSLKAVDAENADELKKTLPEYPLKKESEVSTSSPAISKEAIQLAKEKGLSEEMSYLSAKNIEAWKSALGKISFLENTMLVKSLLSDKTAFIYAPGGYAWSNYNFSVDIAHTIGSKISVLGRYVDSKNYAVCEYIDRGLSAILVEVRGGQRYLVATGNYVAPMKQVSEYGSVGISAVGNIISCFRNGQPVIQTNIPTIPKQGTVGLKVYAASPGFAEIEILNVSVSEI